MKTNTSNGTTKENSGRHKNCLTPDSSSKLGSIEEQSKDYGVEQNRTDQSNSGGENYYRTGEQSSDDSGKVLERLEFIQREYSSYLKEHQQWLKSHLQESQEKELIFETAMQELKHEIRTLISQDEFKQ